ncbi:HIT domain-containing protein [Streptomyces sp. NBC_01433]|uniref:HIT family protein n=1 Tax=Streptomyces sp. NBC_01433 TaxID=2903864 RepID=UPI00224D75A6|nr:HIT domain-containing protein [Streptomyces sp. NBC_01433]MCX4682467.1 HIT domain-containing protein [Streptomyces sp. NBC_01433]MCX4682520.1 HIT domain-containing protein [Streptomyces sp. NBC_01433]
MSADCTFCAIVAGELPATVVREWDDTVAILPRGGCTEGHVLVIPRTHVADAGADPEVTARTMARAAELMAEHEDANIITSKGSVATQTQFHLHVHVVPRVEGDGLALPWTGQTDWDRLVAERDAALTKLSVLADRVEDAGSMMVTDYVREALEGGTARSVAQYVRAQQEAGVFDA